MCGHETMISVSLFIKITLIAFQKLHNSTAIIRPNPVKNFDCSRSLYRPEETEISKQFVCRQLIWYPNKLSQLRREE